MRWIHALFPMASLLAACVVDNSVNRQRVEDSFLQEPPAEADLLWVVDDSPSMSEEQGLVAAGFEGFVSSLADTNIDFHLGVITTDMDLDNPERGQLVGEPAFLTPGDDYVPLFQQRVQVGVDGSDKEKGLEAARYAVTEPMRSGPNAGFLRDDATLGVIFVSDEDDCSDGEALDDEPGTACYDERSRLIPVKQFIQDFRSLKPPGVRVLLSGIIGPDVDEACPDSWPGHRYAAVIQATGGIATDICESDYSSLMDELGLAVSGLITVFELTYPAVEDTIEVSVDDEAIPEDPVNGWRYDSEYWTIRFDGDYVPPRGSSITVSYEILGAAT